jgi:hypothetical protein
MLLRRAFATKSPQPVHLPIQYGLLFLTQPTLFLPNTKTSRSGAVERAAKSRFLSEAQRLDANNKESAMIYLLIIYLITPSGKVESTMYDYPTAVICQQYKADAVKAMHDDPKGWKLVSAECKPVSTK